MSENDEDYMDMTYRASLKANKTYPDSVPCGNCEVHRTVEKRFFKDYGLVESCGNCGDDEYYLWDLPDVP